MSVPRGTQRKISLQKNSPEGLKAFSLQILILSATNNKKYISLFQVKIYILKKRESFIKNVLQRVYNILCSDSKSYNFYNGLFVTLF
jgi:hypothetical protein